MGPYDRETRYRIDGNYCYVYIKNGDFEMKCDIGKMEILKSHIWNCTKGRLPNVRQGEIRTPMANILFPNIQRIGYKDNNTHNLTEENIYELERKCYIKNGECYIPLFGGKEAVCDADRIADVSLGSWYEDKNSGMPKAYIRGTKQKISLLALLFPNIKISYHINGDKLNFRSNNIRAFIRECYIENDICYIPMTNGDVAICDPQDIDKVQKHNWCKNRNGYASATIDNKSKEMHKFLFPQISFLDHINRNRLDNRSCNVRQATRQESGRNRNMFSNNKSGYKGVSFDKRSGKFVVYLGIGGGKMKYLGRFNGPIEAALVYDKHAKELFKEFAVLNFPDEIKEQSNG